MTNQEITNVGQQIYDETNVGANTSNRVGGVIKGIGENLSNISIQVGFFQILKKFVNNTGALYTANSVLIKVPKSSVIKITHTSNNTYYCFLSSFNSLSDFTFATGYNGRVYRSGASVYTFNAPADANYLWMIQANAFANATSITINDEEVLNIPLTDRVNMVWTALKNLGPIDNLESKDALKALSANQGYILNRLVSEITGNKLNTRYYVDNNGGWFDSTDPQGVMIPILNSSTIRIKRTGYIYYTLVNTFSGFGGDNTITFATGFSGRIYSNGTTDLEIIAPADANYIFLMDKNINSITVNGIEVYNKNIYQRFFELKSNTDNALLVTAQTLSDAQKQQTLSNIGIDNAIELVETALSWDKWNLAEYGEITEKTGIGTDLDYITQGTFFTVKNAPIPNGAEKLYFTSKYYINTYNSTGYNNQYAARRVRFKDENGGLIINIQNTTRSPYTIPAGAKFVDIMFAYYDSQSANSALEEFFITVKGENEHEDSVKPNFETTIIEGVEGIEAVTEESVCTISTYIRDGKILKMPPKTKLPTVAFVFDDIPDNDELIVSLFDEFSLNCGFAYISGLATNEKKAKYLKWQAKGYQILHHGSIAITGSGNSKPLTTDNYTYAEAMEEILTSVYSLRAEGFVINGWVTPDAQFAASFQPIIELSHAYCFPSTNQVSANVRDSDVGLLRRDTLQGKTLAQIKANIDSAITGDNLLVFYGHSHALVDGGGTDEFSIAQLRAVLEYCIEKRDSGQLYVSGVDDAVKYFFDL